MQLRAIDFLRNVAEPFRDRLPAMLIAGMVGPWGDAYELNETITAEAAEEYHDHQLGTLAEAGVDLASAMTFNNIPEAIGVSRAAARHGVPLSVSFTFDSSSRLHSGPTLQEAIETIDEDAGDARPAFYGINCSHPFEFLPALDGGPWFERVRAIRPNAAAMDKIALCTLGHLESGDPVHLGQLTGDLAAQYPHIDIWGGCCGTWDEHLDEIGRQVRTVRTTASA